MFPTLSLQHYVTADSSPFAVIKKQIRCFHHPRSLWIVRCLVCVGKDDLCFSVYFLSTGDQLVPLEGPRTLDRICRDENQAGQLQKLREQKKAIIDRWTCPRLHLISSALHPTSSLVISRELLVVHPLITKKTKKNTHTKTITLKVIQKQTLHYTKETISRLFSLCVCVCSRPSLTHVWLYFQTSVNKHTVTSVKGTKHL